MLLLFTLVHVAMNIVGWFFGIPGQLLSFFRNRGKETLVEKIVSLSIVMSSLDTNSSRKILRHVAHYLHDVSSGKVMAALVKAQISLMDRDNAAKKHIEELDRVSNKNIISFYVVSVFHSKAGIQNGFGECDASMGISQ